MDPNTQPQSPSPLQNQSQIPPQSQPQPQPQPQPSSTPKPKTKFILIGLLGFLLVIFIAIVIILLTTGNTPGGLFGGCETANSHQEQSTETTSTPSDAASTDPTTTTEPGVPSVALAQSVCGEQADKFTSQSQNSTSSSDINADAYLCAKLSSSGDIEDHFIIEYADQDYTTTMSDIYGDGRAVTPGDYANYYLARAIREGYITLTPITDTPDYYRGYIAYTDLGINTREFAANGYLVIYKNVLIETSFRDDAKSDAILSSLDLLR